MSRRAVCARLEARSSPCCCRRRAVPRPTVVSTRHRRASSPARLRSPIAFSSSWRCCRSCPGASSSTSGGRFGAPQRQSAQFLDVFRRSNKFSEVQAVCRSLGESPLVGLFQSGYAELTAQLRQSTPDDRQRTQSAARPPDVLLLKSLHGRGSRAAARVGRRGEQAGAAACPFLATTASIAPFIGLFGTVVGNHDRISSASAQTGSTNLGVVGARHRRSAGRDGGRPGRRDPGRGRSTTI